MYLRARTGNSCARNWLLARCVHKPVFAYTKKSAPKFSILQALIAILSLKIKRNIIYNILTVTDQIKPFGIASYRPFFICFRSNTMLIQLFSQTICNSYVPKNNYVFEIN